jgi:hypothetical protein
MSNHTLKYSETYEVCLYIGSREGYHGPLFTRNSLIDAISEFQDHVGEQALPVRVSDTLTFLKGKSYAEDGWEVSAILYPNRPSTISAINDFMLKLAEYLLYKFNQNRITIRHLFSSSNKTIMLERKDAEASHLRRP